MANSKELFAELVNKITLDESKDEIESIVYLIMESHLGLSRNDVLSAKQIGKTGHRLEEIVDRINRQEPVQYILGEAWFYGRRFEVDANVLIPRPETELIVKMSLDQFRLSPHGTILDIGTGSGCLAITLAKELPDWKMYATDVSEAALGVAAVNAKRHQARVEFYRHDVLAEKIPWKELALIVSNPPYVTEAEKTGMKKNVLGHEPHKALFVANEDPLIFYKVIARQGRQALRVNGKVIVEINERFGDPVAHLFRDEGYSSVSVGKDLSGKDRVVTAGT